MAGRSLRQSLEDPRWQQLCLRIFDRDNWACVLCGESKAALHAHRWRHRRCEPWDSPIEEISTLCVNCRDREVLERTAAMAELGEVLSDCHWSAADISDLAATIDQHFIRRTLNDGMRVKAMTLGMRNDRLRDEWLKSAEKDLKSGRSQGVFDFDSTDLQ